MTTQTETPRTYGNWRRPTTPGLWKFGTLGTFGLLGGLVLAVVVNAVLGLLAAGVWLLLLAFVLAPLAYRNRNNRTGWQVIATQVTWHPHKRRRHNIYIAGHHGPLAFGECRLPGLLAASRLYEARDAYGDPFALIHVPAARHYTVPIRVEPSGDELVDQDTIDTWVASYGQFLAELPHVPGLVAATVTVETAPDPGHRLRSEIARQVSPDAPALAREVMEECAATYPAGGADLRAWLSLTFDAKRPEADEREIGGDAPRRGVRYTPGEMAEMIGSRLPGLIAAVGSTGAGGQRAMTAAEIAEAARVAYDPAAAEEIDRLRADGAEVPLQWSDVGPTAAEVRWGSYRHDGALSMTWGMREPSRGAVHSNVLRAILAPHDGLARKRVTIVYRPHAPADAASIADADRRTALGAVDGRATNDAEVAAARRTAAEEAAGAGLLRFALLATTTAVTDEQAAQMPALVAELAGASRLRLRRLYGSQDAAFSAALGFGVILPSHVSTPAVIREHL